MAETAVRSRGSGTREHDAEPGWFVGLLLRRRGLVLLTALLLIVLAGMAGRDAGDKLVSGAYLDPSAESQQAAEVLARHFPGGPPNLVLIVETRTDPVPEPVLGLAVLALAAVFVIATLRDRRRPDASTDADPDEHPACHGPGVGAHPDNHS